MKQVCVSVLVVLAIMTSAVAQNAHLSGLVKDKTGAVIAAASVTLTNVEAGAISNVKSSPAGYFVFASVAPGKYALNGEALGFDKTVIENLKLDTAANVSLDIVLQVKHGQEAIVVNATPTQLAETTGAVSTVVDRTLIENLPLNGNSLQTLFELTPGVVTNAGGSPSNGGGISVDGQRPTSNYLTIDGASGNIYIPPSYAVSNVTGAGIATSASGGTNGLLPVDAVEEFRMQTSSYSAEYGRTPGGQIEVRTRGGTNAFHGSLFENFRNQVMDAQDWFIGYDNAVYGSNLKQPPLRMNDFGGTFGGPILKNRLFFFVAHESLLMDQPQPPGHGDVPDQQTRSTAAPAFQPYLNVYPIGNSGPDSRNPGSDIYTFSHSNVIRDHTTSARLDADFPRGIHAFVRVNDAPSYFLVPYVPNSTQVNINIVTVTSGFSAQLSAKAINQFTVNYSSNEGSNGDARIPKAYLQTVSSLTDPSKTIIGFYPSAWLSIEGGPPIPNQLHQFNIVDTFTWVLGKHVLHTGVDYRKSAPAVLRPPGLQLYTGYSPTSVQSGVLDFVYYEQFLTEPHIKIANTSLYADDDWRVSKRLTLNLGLRWEFNPPPSAARPGLLAMQGDPNNPASITLAPAGTALYKAHYDNLAPRVGFAFAVHDSARFGTVLRGGGGVFFDTGQSATAAQASLLQYPYQGIGFAQNIPYSAFSVDQFQIVSAALPQGRLYLTNPQLTLPRTYNWSLTVQQSIGSSTSLSATYVGNHGDKLLKQNEYDGLSPSLANTLYVYSNGEASSYNSVQVQSHTRVSNRLNVLASYTFAHAIDNGSSEFNSVGAYQKNYRADSDNDLRNVFSAAIHYETKGITGSRVVRALTTMWSLDSVVLLQSAPPISVYSYTSNNPTLYNQYADVVPGVPVLSSNSRLPGGKDLNPAAFIAAPGTRNGTSPRNGYRLFGLNQFDLAVSRSWRLWEGGSMTFRVDGFNVINVPNFAQVDSYLGSPTFGQATATYAGANGSTSGLTGGSNTVFSNGGARSVQLAMKLRF